MPMYYELEVPVELIGDAFEKMMEKEISPLVDRQLTRVGNIEGDSLFHVAEGSSTYVWAIRWSGSGTVVGGKLDKALDALKKHDVEVRELVPAQTPAAVS
jgi:hypothetical protein